MIKNEPKLVILQRVITSIFLLLVVVAIIKLPTYYVHSILAVTVLIAAWEWSGFCYNRTGWRLAYSFLTVVLFLLMLNPLLISIVSIITAFLWSLGFLRLYSFNSRMQSPVIVLLSGIVLLIGFALSIVALQQSPNALIVLLAIVVSADILGFAIGKNFGEKPLSPRISPKKTWEGLYAGLIGALVLGLLFYTVFDISLLKIVSICIIGTLVSVLGDLFISCYKREAGIKDTGTLLPGHGGLLDRIDGFIALAPIFWVLVTWSDVVFVT